MFNQINIKTRNTCQEADKVTSNEVSNEKCSDNRDALRNAWIINSCNNAWIINSFYFEYGSPLRSDYEITLSIRSEMYIFVPKSERIRSDSDRICTPLMPTLNLRTGMLGERDWIALTVARPQNRHRGSASRLTLY
jgi:hypothetical protein